MHQAGHVKCSAAYNLSMYSEWNMAVKYLNTQVAEQFNSTLRKHATKLAFMTGEHALEHVIQVSGRAGSWG